MKITIKESQYDQLIKKKRSQKIANQILESINRIPKNLNEDIQKDAILSTLKLYNKKGLINEEVKSILSTDKIINKQ